jgi:hypothetical protein
LKLQLLAWLVPPDRLNIVQALVSSCDGGHKKALCVALQLAATQSIVYRSFMGGLGIHAGETLGPMSTLFERTWQAAFRSASAGTYTAAWTVRQF